MENSFKKLMQAFEPLPSKIAVAVSGGGDSMALTMLADKWAKETGCKIIALTVDHGLRKEAAKEAKQVAKWLSIRKIEHHILTNQDKEKPVSNVQKYARNKRYELLTEWCKENKIKDILVAHHAEDQAETFLLRLERGSGVDGLAAMQPQTTKHGIRVLRPLLEVKKGDLIKYLKNQHQDWIEDPSNSSDAFKRSTLRKALKKVAVSEDLLTQRINQTAKVMARAKEALEFVTEKYTQETVEMFDSGYAIADKKTILSLPEEIGLRILRNILRTIGGRKLTPRFEELKRFYDNLAMSKVFKACTLWGCKISPHEKEKIIIIREVSDIEKDGKVRAGRTTLWDKRFIISLDDKSEITNLNIRIFKKNELSQFIKSLSEIEQKKISKLIPKSVLESVPVFTSGKNKLENIEAVPHIDYYKNKKLKSLLICHFKPLIDSENNGFPIVAKKNML